MGESISECVVAVRCTFCASSRRNSRLTAAKIARLVAAERPKYGRASFREEKWLFVQAWLILKEKWLSQKGKALFPKESLSKRKGPLPKSSSQREVALSQRSSSLLNRRGSVSKGSCRLDNLRSEGALAIGEAQPRAMAFNVERGRRIPQLHSGAPSTPLEGAPSSL